MLMMAGPLTSAPPSQNQRLLEALTGSGHVASAYQSPPPESSDYFMVYTNHVFHMVFSYHDDRFDSLLERDGGRGGDKRVSRAAKLEILYSTASGLRGTAQLRADTVLKELIDKRALPIDFEEGEARDLGRRFIWAAVGWITAMFDPVARPPPRTLDVCAESHDCFEQPSQNIAVLQDPITLILHGFGKVLPWRQDHTDHGTEDLDARTLNTAVIFQLAKIEIEWVSSIGVHFELDMERRKLKLFRLPSLCLTILKQEGALHK